MGFAIDAVGELAADIQRIAIVRRIAIRQRVPADGFLGDVVDPGAARWARLCR